MHVSNRSAEIDHDWHAVDGDAPLPAAGDVVLPLARWLAERDGLGPRDGRLGVRLTGADDVSALAGNFARIDRIVVLFAKGTDGRGYSQARLLRERYGYRGELQATGELLPDHLHFLHRCGFDHVTLPAGVERAEIVTALTAISHGTQPAGDGGELAFRRARRPTWRPEQSPAA
ncbi:MAG: DUF934 domain-containing protein [Gammaproteobacteria bacterium]|nr:DUF934 domain-containing protein [Gammaproteobacteria bacterium]